MTALEDPPTIGQILNVKSGRIAEILANRPLVDDEPVGDAETEAAREFGYGAWRQERWVNLIPSRFHFASLDDLAEPWRGQISAWALTPQRTNLVIAGDLGTGKSHAACAACRHAHDSGLTVLFLPVVEMLDQLRPGGPPEALDEFCDVDRLIIDDLGSEKPTDWTAERLYAVVNRRWLEERPTIVTTNLAATALRDAVGPRTYSRVVGSGACMVNMTGVDRRRGR